jgi:two-component system CheB/CheR fusion protein
VSEGEEDRELDLLLDYLKAQRGFDFTGYKRPSLMRRIAKRMSAVGAQGFEEYLDRLEVEPAEVTQLFNTVLINVTRFFRDESTWEFVATEALPALLERKSSKDPIRLWSAGCATGEEAYTLAMVVAEVMGLDEYRARVKVYATDADEEALNYARQATYTPKQVEGLSPERLERFFEPIDGRFCFRKDIRRTVIFGRNDLIQDAPISRVDLLSCRNTLMYFDATTQARILSRFHFALTDGGILVLGRAETMLTHSSLFAPVDLKRRVFTQVPRLRGRPVLTDRHNGDPVSTLDLQETRFREAAFDVGTTAQVVIDRAGRLTMANERARTLFRMRHSDLGRPIQDLELSFRPAELRGPIEQAYRDHKPVVIRDVLWHSQTDEPRWYEVQIMPLGTTAGEIGGASISFTDTSAFKASQSRLEQAAQELESAYEELQSTNEELETTNEELHSTVEELETTNEELQSTNEELETMNEELQSTNEELQGANEELHRQSTTLNEVNDFQDAIFSSLRWGIAILDSEMRVIEWNRRSEDLWGIRAEEIEGQPFLELDSGLPVDRLAEPIRQCLEGVVNDCEITVPAMNRRGRPIECRVIVMPLRTSRQRETRGVMLLMEGEPAAS